HVRLVGAGAETVLRKAPERYSRLAAYVGYGHYDVSVADPDRFAVGMGVTIRDDNAVGFYETIATLTWRDGDRFGIGHMLNHDYAPRHGGELYTSFPPVSARFIANVEVRDLVIDGNRGENPHTLNGCRGAGMYLLAVSQAVVANVAVRDLNGDAIGFQQCRDLRLEDCVLENNAGHGLHPGSGSLQGAMRRCRCVGNGGDGIFFCLRATYCICESCKFVGNRGHGVSIGERDTHNAIVGCGIEGNGDAGVHFRDTDEVMAPHATLVAGNDLADNCREQGEAEISVQGAVGDVHVLENVIRRQAGARPVAGVRVASAVVGAQVWGNRCQGDFTAPTQVEPGAKVGFTRPERELPVGPDAAPADADRHLPPQVRGGAPCRPAQPNGSC
ncbi:MAG TPA: right-handed parallel beta-helix repeat-containing protein, partial [Armatimonadota bacterium]|nr:right-handed parallel beta-helix repeat-containing protein [Armatimonadota bacterium]